MINKTKFIAAAALIAAAFLPATAFAKNPKWEPAISKFEAQDAQTSPPRNGILFVGSSSIVKWDVKKAFPDLPVINRGFGGSVVSDVNDYFDRVVTPYQPCTIVFYSGDNDLSGGKTTATVTQDVKTFVQMVHDKVPGARVILLPPKPSISRWKIWPLMKEVGEQEKAIADADPNVEFLDTAQALLTPAGETQPEYYLGDKLHMTDKGYAVWNAMLRPMLVDGGTTSSGRCAKPAAASSAK